MADGLLYAGVGLAERREQAADALARVGLSHREPARPTQLSGVSVNGWPSPGHSSVTLPSCWPTSPPATSTQATGQSILGLFEDLHDAGVTIVVITHDRDIAERLPRRIEMLDGRIVADTVRVPDVRSRSRGCPTGGPTCSGGRLGTRES